VPKVQYKPIKVQERVQIKRAKDNPKAALVWRTRLSDAPPDSVRCSRELNSELATFRNSGSHSAIIHLQEFGLRIKKIRSDNGTEFKNSQIEGFLEEEGIKHEFSSPYTPQQNGVVERKNRSILDMARTMLDTSLPSPNPQEDIV
jgi:transposase InsO family protein